MFMREADTRSNFKSSHVSAKNPERRREIGVGSGRGVHPASVGKPSPPSPEPARFCVGVPREVHKERVKSLPLIQSLDWS